MLASILNERCYLHYAMIIVLYGSLIFSRTHVVDINGISKST